MKIECPVCGVQGHLQRRGNSFRIGHYKSYNKVTGTRIIEWHRVTIKQLQLINKNGKQNMVNNKAKIGSKLEFDKVVVSNVSGPVVQWYLKEYEEWLKANARAHKHCNILSNFKLLSKANEMIVFC